MYFESYCDEQLQQIISDSKEYPGVWEIAVEKTTCRLMEIELIKRGVKYDR